jgi:tRNA-splicing ligase RtcB
MARMIEVERGIPIWVWGRTVAVEAQAQLEKLARQPYVVGHIAAMPDLHVASGVAVGSVFATERFIVPSALGGDLGCGVSAVHFAALASGLDLRRVFAEWSARIPVGDAVHRGRQGEAFEAPLSTQALEHQRERLAPKHLGTLGGGNHFVELDRDASGELWLLVHSGSRGLGAAIGAHHSKAADARGMGSIPGLDLASPEGQACLADTAWALAFAAANRRALVAAASEAITAQTVVRVRLARRGPVDDAQASARAHSPAAVPPFDAPGGPRRAKIVAGGRSSSGLSRDRRGVGRRGRSGPAAVQTRAAGGVERLSWKGPEFCRRAPSPGVAHR